MQIDSGCRRVCKSMTVANITGKSMTVAGLSGRLVLTGKIQEPDMFFKICV